MYFEEATMMAQFVKWPKSLSATSRYTGPELRFPAPVLKRIGMVGKVGGRQIFWTHWPPIPAELESSRFTDRRYLKI